MAFQGSYKTIRWKISYFMIILGIISACFKYCSAEEDTYSKTKHMLKVKQNGKLRLFQHLEAYNLTQLYKITPSTYIFEYRGTERTNDLRGKLSRVSKSYKDKIIEMEPVREYKDSLRPESPVTEEFKNTKALYRLPETNLVCDEYYGMGVSGAWSRGYSGLGVLIAVTDVGINTELDDLMDNINTNLSYNFVDESSNVTPEFFYNIQEKAAELTDHGNAVASIIAATKGNNLCSAGIAYNASIIALKIYRVELYKEHFLGLHPSHWTKSDIIARALAHKLNHTDIFANAWAPTKPFDPLDLATREAIRYGAKHGRHGLGTIHIVPSGPPGNELSNNIHTITVNSIGRYGTIPGNIYIDASVLTSGLGEGNNLTASSMVTTSLKNKCVTGFNSVSAATSQLAAISGLAIEANKNLSLRDVQYLFVHASGREGLREENAFRANAAGLYFHDFFGFGLIDADLLVTLAEKHMPLPPLLSRTLPADAQRLQTVRPSVIMFCYACNSEDNHHCLTTVEQVMVKMKLKTTADEIKISLKSPSETRTVLIDSKLKQGELLTARTLRLVSVHFWDELPFGRWSLYIHTPRSSGAVEVSQISLTLYGTSRKAIAKFGKKYDEICDTKNDVNTTTLKPVEATTLISLKTESFILGFVALYVVPGVLVLFLGVLIFWKELCKIILLKTPKRIFRYNSVATETDDSQPNSAYIESIEDITVQ